MIREMSPSETGTPAALRDRTEAQSGFSWSTIIWVSALLLICYASVLWRLVKLWYNDGDMGHGFFVPVISAYIAWQVRGRVAGVAAKPNWWGLPIMIFAALQLWIGTLGAELFLARTSFVFSLIGAVLLLGGTAYLRAFGFSLFLLFFMIPIPAIIYNQITFPLQLFASRVAEASITVLGIPVIRTGNILELAQQKLNVVEACSGIRSLLTLTFLSLVYGYFSEKRAWVRVTLFLATIPIAIIQNAGRVTITGVAAQFNPDLAEGWFHEAQGWVTFMVAFAILALFHQLLIRSCDLFYGKKPELSPAQ
jgi:exosortase